MTPVAGRARAAYMVSVVITSRVRLLLTSNTNWPFRVRRHTGRGVYWQMKGIHTDTALSGEPSQYTATKPFVEV